MNLYHFLPAPFGIQNLERGRLKVSLFSDLNDPFELEAVNVGGKKLFRKALRTWKAELSKKKGLLCFSADWHDPVMWSHYAAKHHGMCLGFEVPDGKALKVEYATDRIKAHVRNDGTFDENDPFVESLFRTKFENWRYEKEYRIVVDLDECQREGDLYFVPFSNDLRLFQVILGAFCDVSADHIRTLVAPPPEVYVNRTRQAYKFFSVVDETS